MIEMPLHMSNAEIVAAAFKIYNLNKKGDQGVVEAQYNLGVAYTRGEGV